MLQVDLLAVGSGTEKLSEGVAKPAVFRVGAVLVCYK